MMSIQPIPILEDCYSLLVDEAEFVIVHVSNVPFRFSFWDKDFNTIASKLGHALSHPPNSPSPTHPEGPSPGLRGGTPRNWRGTRK